MVGATPAKSHIECLHLVCAVCTNLNGTKAERTVTSNEELLIKKHVFTNFRKGSFWLPQGICTKCRIDLNTLGKQGSEREEGNTCQRAREMGTKRRLRCK